MTRRKISLYASITVTILHMAYIVFAVIFLPKMLGAYSEFRGGVDFSDVIIALYISAPAGLICTIALLKLLFNIKKDEIFVQKNVILLQVLSYCCLFVGVEYVIVAHKFITMLFFAFAALFIGLILRVIKNVFDKAIEIREENDLTV